MKLSILKFLSVLTAFLSFFGNELLAQNLPQAYYSSNFSKAEILWNDATHSPRDIKFIFPSGLTRNAFFTAYKKAFGLSAKNSFRLIKEKVGPLGQIHYRYKQYYKGIEIADAQYLLHTYNGLVSHAHGNIVVGLNIDVTPVISAQQAITIANKYLGNSTDVRNVSREKVSDLRASLMRPQQKPHLVISAGNRPKLPENYHLAYRVDVITTDPLGRYYVDIDAHTGELMGKISRIYTENYTSRSLSLYDDTVDIVVSDTLNGKTWSMNKTHWHLDPWMAYGDSGVSWWVADTGYLDVGGYNVLWYEGLQTDPVIISGNNPQLSFYQRYSVEPPSKTVHGYDGYDGLDVRISTDHGVTWRVLTGPSPVYTCKSLYGFGTNFEEGQGIQGWSGTQEQWSPATFDLSEYANDTILIRFAFCSDELYSSYDYPNWFGWQIDNIKVSSSNGELYSNTGSKDNISVVNLKHFSNSGKGLYRLRETSRGPGIATIDTHSILWVDQFTDYSENELPIDSLSPEGVSLQYGLEKTFDFYYNIFGRNSFDDRGSDLIAYANWIANEGWNNAAWYGDFAAFGGGDSINVKPLVSLDIVGHEITHGVTEQSAGLIYQGESGALNESFSDIFGTAIEFYAEGPDKANWLIGEKPYAKIIAIRSMADPNLFKNPDTYLGKFWILNGNSYDAGGVHTNSGVQNYWFYLLSEGGTGTNDDGYSYNVSGIGIADAEQIAYRTLTLYLTPESDYFDAATYSLQSAVDLFGQDSPQARAVADAWNAVGIFYVPRIAALDSLVLETPVNETTQVPLIIKSKGTVPLIIGNIYISGEGFSISDLPHLPMEMGEINTIELTVSFQPSQVANYSGVIHLFSNDSEQPVKTVYLKGIADEPSATEIASSDRHTPGFTNVHPNPFSEFLDIRFNTSQNGQVRICVINSTGTIIRELTDKVYAPGTHTLTWKGVDQNNTTVPAGNYFLVMYAQGKRFIQPVSRY